ncbi:SigE family RNA polymerase sigma factor [Nakamurella antarctica]|uniref:SigE family RNA polymerase sigma factor n=1 Tax=Nakamurella antarctica TaxID=1902245 RepID=A0A3G8ZS71_9ACTN|nr:SigE family RNA polymerase sigma factor [Nakamurella antarctica]
MKAQDESDFASYFAARRDHVRRTAFLLCGDWHKADDLTQVAFVKLYGAWERIRERAALDAYVRACLVRTSIDESRRPWRRERTVEILPESADTAAADIASMVVEREAVEKALAVVPPGQRAVLVLRYFEGLDVAQTASTLRCSEGNVKSQTARGLTAMRAAMTSQAGGTAA